MLKIWSFLLFVSSSALAQESIVHFTLAQSSNEDCQTEFAVNGYYSIQASEVSRLKIPGANLVVPYALLDSANVLLGRQSHYGSLASLSFSRNDFREVSEAEALEILRSQSETYPNSLYDLNAEQLAALGVYKIPNPEPEQDLEPVQETVEIGYNWDTDGVISGVYILPYHPQAYLIRDNSSEKQLQNDSLHAAWGQIRHHLQKEIQDLTSPFYLSKNEVSNAEYREFVNWVKDSVAREILYLNLEDNEEAFDLLDYKRRWKESYRKEAEAFLRDTANSNDRDLPYYLDIDDGNRAKNREICHFDRNIKLDFSEPKIAQALEVGGYFYPSYERFYLRKEVDVGNLIYSVNGMEVHVYPDTFGLIQLMEDSRYPEFGRLYFCHPYFDNYPVMGVSREQALAYCHWKEKQLHSRLTGSENIHVQLPEIVHYEWALKSILPSHSRYYAATIDSSYLVDYKRSVDEASAVFLNPAGTKNLTARKQLKKLERAFGSTSTINDLRPLDYQVSLFNQWSSDYPAGTFNDLFGNLSEWTNTPAGSDAYYVLGANYQQVVKTLDEHRFNALFYRQKMQGSIKSPLIGFRLLYQVNASQSAPE